MPSRLEAYRREYRSHRRFSPRVVRWKQRRRTRERMTLRLNLKSSYKKVRFRPARWFPYLRKIIAHYAVVPGVSPAQVDYLAADTPAATGSTATRRDRYCRRSE